MFSSFEVGELENALDGSEEYCSSKETFGLIANAVPSVLNNVALALSIAPETESPIEVLFGVEFTKFISSTRLKFTRCHQSVENDFGRDHILLIPQYCWRNFRIDWAIKVPFLKQPLYFVECDGRDFHSSDAQIARDQRKDSEVLQAGIQIFRFTGSELERNTAACVRVTFDVIERQYFNERRITLQQSLTPADCRKCHLKVELSATLATLAGRLKPIHQFHDERGLKVRQGPPIRSESRNQEFVRWYFEGVEEAAAFQQEFGGRLICSSAL